MSFFKKHRLLDASALTACIHPTTETENTQSSDEIDEENRRCFTECGKLGQVRVIELNELRSIERNVPRYQQEQRSEENPFTQTSIADPYTGETVPLRTFIRRSSVSENSQNFRGAKFCDRATSTTDHFDSGDGIPLSYSSSIQHDTSDRKTDVAVRRESFIVTGSRSSDSVIPRTTSFRAYHVIGSGIVAPPCTPVSDLSQESGGSLKNSTFTINPASTDCTASTFTTARTGEASGSGSLEWDNYQPVLGANYRPYTRATTSQATFLDTVQYWV